MLDHNWMEGQSRHLCFWGPALPPPFQVCRAGAPSVRILVRVKDPPLAHDGRGHQVLLRQSSIPRMWGSGDPHSAAFRQSGVFSGSQSLEGNVKLIIIIHSVALSLKRSERRREGRGRVLGHRGVKGHSVLGKQHGSFSKVKQNDRGSSSSTSGYASQRIENRDSTRSISPLV